MVEQNCNAATNLLFVLSFKPNTLASNLLALSSTNSCHAQPDPDKNAVQSYAPLYFSTVVLVNYETKVQKNKLFTFHSEPPG